MSVAVIGTYAPDKYCKIVEMSVDVDKIVVKLIASIIVFRQQIQIHSNDSAQCLLLCRKIVFTILRILTAAPTTKNNKC